MWFITLFFRWNVQVSKVCSHNISRQIFPYVHYEGVWEKRRLIKDGRQLHDHAFRRYPVNRKLDGLSTCLYAPGENNLLDPLEVEPRFLGHPACNLYWMPYPRPKIFPQFFYMQVGLCFLDVSHSGDSIIITFSSLLDNCLWSTHLNMYPPCFSCIWLK